MEFEEIFEIVAERERAEAKRLSWLYRLAAGLGLALAAAMLPFGRDLPLRIVGYVSAALVVPICVSLAARALVRSAEGLGRQPSLRWVWMANLAAWGLAIVHAAYVVRRFI